MVIDLARVSKSIRKKSFAGVMRHEPKKDKVKHKKDLFKDE